MPKPKWSTFSSSKEYEIWLNIETICKQYNLSGDTFSTMKDAGGFYWEPLLERIYKLGVTLKSVPKSIKEIKMDHIRPLLYLGSQTNEDIIFDGDPYIVDKGAIGQSTQVRYAFRSLLDSMTIASTLNEENFAQEVKTMKENVKHFFKTLSIFIKEGFRPLHENIKEILKPLRMLRKSAYCLFSIEKQEEGNVDLTLFQDRQKLEMLTNSIKDHFKWEEFKVKRDCNVEMLRDFLSKNAEQDRLKYSFTDEKRKEIEVKKENPYESIARKNLEVKPKKTIGKIDKTEIKASSAAEMQKKKEEEERIKLLCPNIKDLAQPEPTKFIKEAFQEKFEEGIFEMVKYLNRKLPNQFPIIINTHKIFVNIKNIPHNKENVPTHFYVDQLEKAIYKLKVKCYEMKLNGLSRVLIPILENVEFCNIVKTVYNLSVIIENVIGDKLKLNQFLFTYEKIKNLTQSNIKNELDTIKNKDFIEVAIVKYIIFESLCQSAKVLKAMKENAKSRKVKFDIGDYFQLSKLNIDEENKNSERLYNYEEKKPRIPEEIEFQKDKSAVEKEVKIFGRYLLFENFFAPCQKEKWVNAIEQLYEINTLVQEDIRDFILINWKQKGKNEEGVNNINTNINTSADNNNNNSNKTKVDRSKNIINPNKKKRKTNKSPKKKPVVTITTNKSPKKKSVIAITTNKELIDSKETEEERELRKVANANIEALRPPNVWNFPIERVKEAKKEYDNQQREKMKQKEDNKEKFNYEYKMNNPEKNYKDGRVERFMEIFEEICVNSMLYCKEKQNDKWEYLVHKIFLVLSINYEGFKRFDIKNEIEKEKDKENEDEKEEEEKEIEDDANLIN